MRALLLRLLVLMLLVGWVCPSRALAASTETSGGSSAAPLQTVTNFLKEAGQLKDDLARDVNDIAWNVGNDFYQVVAGSTAADTSGSTQGGLPADFMQQWQDDEVASNGEPPVSPAGDLLSLTPGCVGGDAACVTSDPNVFIPTAPYTQQRAQAIAAANGDAAALPRTMGSLIEAATSAGVVTNANNPGAIYDNPTKSWVGATCGNVPSSQACNAPNGPVTLSISSTGRSTTYQIDKNYAGALLLALANWHCQNVTSEPSCSSPHEALQAIQIEESAHAIAAGIGYQNGAWNQYQSIVDGVESSGEAFSSNLTAQAIEIEGLGRSPMAGGTVASLVAQGVPIIGSGRPCINGDQIQDGSSVTTNGAVCAPGYAPAAGFWYANSDGSGNVVGLTFLTVTQTMLQQSGGCQTDNCGSNQPGSGGCQTDPCNGNQPGSNCPSNSCDLGNFGQGSGLPGAPGVNPTGGGSPQNPPPPTAAPQADFVWGLPGSEGYLAATMNGPSVSSSPWKGLIGQAVGIKEKQPVPIIDAPAPGPGVEKWIPNGQPSWKMECYLAVDCDPGASFATGSGQQITKAWNFSSYLQPHSIGPSPTGAIDPTTGQTYDERGYLVAMTQIYDHYTSFKTCEGGSPGSPGHPGTACHDVWHWNPPVQVPSAASHAIMIRQYKSVLASSR